MQASPTASAKKENIASTCRPEDGDWQKYVLGRLQEKLSPEPIMVACMKPPEKRHLLIEEYHGKLSKEAVNQLLAGKTGRYLVRDSQSSGCYTLSYNFDGEIKHQKITFKDNKYKTDEADSEEYETVHKLMSYVLGLCKKMKQIEGSKKKPYQKMHEFGSHTYVHPKWCDVCGGFIWGLWSQGLKCEDCGIGIHKHCRESASDPCEKIVLGQKINNPSPPIGKDLRKRYSSPDTGQTKPIQRPKSLSKNLSAPICSYEQECFKFLTSQVPVSYFDRESLLNKCYCSEHLDTQTKTPSMQNWCRFALVRSSKEMEKNLKVAYFSVFPRKIKETLDALASGSFYQRLQADELVVLPSLANIAIMEPYENERQSIRTVLEIGVENGKYTIKSAVDDNASGHDKAAKLEYWSVMKGHQIVSLALLVKITKD